MNWRKLTAIFIVLVVVIILGYDALALYKGGIEATISSIVIDTSHRVPFIPFLFGVLIGHLFT